MPTTVRDVRLARQKAMTPARFHLRESLKTPLDQKYCFETKLGDGARLVANIRSLLSRIRKRMRDANDPIMFFRLYGDVNPQTERGKDLVTLIRSQDTHTVMSTEVSKLADMMSAAEDAPNA